MKLRIPSAGIGNAAKEWREARRKYPWTVAGVTAAFVAVSAILIVGGAWFLAGLLTSMPDAQAIRRIGEMDQATAVFDHDDTLAFTIFKEQRIEVPLAEVSPNLIRAIVAIEDQRFYEHHGFDLIRIVSAALSNIRRAERAQGGSTITQQLARQSFLTMEKTYRRKVQELVLAARIERLYTKPRILELYLNKVYFGDGLYGAEAAARGYFGKHASELTVPEAALLAGLVKSPSTYAPTVSLQRAINRRNVVLQAMLDTKAIDRGEWQSARALRPTLRDTLRSDEPYGRYFKEQVRRELVDRFGWQRVYQGGLRVFSTVDIRMQQAADAAVAKGLVTLDERRAKIAARRAAAKTEGGGPAAEDPLQAALVAMDPATGHVRAMVGGRSFAESSFNRAVQAKRQPGSAFKPFVYAVALESGYTPATMITGLDEPIATLQGDWTPEDEHSDAPSMSLRTGLRTSSNRAAVRLLQDVGIPETVKYAKTMGVGDVPSVPSLALGSGEVTLESMTAAYAAFAHQGYVPQPRLIRRVEDKAGQVLYSTEPSSTYAVSETTAFLMASMLADVINAGTGARARGLGFTLPAAGKTGTTNDFHDAWFVGFTPSLVAGVWVGFDQPKTILPEGFASEVAVPTWTEFMKAATKSDRPQWLATPPEITTANVCRLSGQLARSACEHVDVMDEKSRRLESRSMVYTEYFVRGTEPTQECSLHQPRTVFGTLASIFKGGEDQFVPPPPPTAAEAGLPPPTAAAAEPAPSVTPPPPPPAQKKRGFWSRVFGRRDDSDRNNSEPSAEPSKKK
jgi:penicillin-binding protein 1A